MKNLRILAALCAAAGAALLLALLTRQFATQPALAEVVGQSTKTVSLEYWLLPPLPDPSQLELPGRLSRAEARQAAAGWARQQAAGMLDELTRLQAQGLVGTVRFDPAELALQVALTASTDQALERLQAVPGVASVQPANLPSTCLPEYGQALVEHLFQAANRPELPQVQSATLLPPSIFAYAPEGSEYTSIYGSAWSATSVTLTIKRGQTLIFSGSAASDVSGYYEFTPAWRGGCPGSAYAWNLLPGDVIQVSANGLSASMTVARLTSWIDPLTDQVLGTTAPGLDVQSSVWQDAAPDRCVDEDYETWTISQSDGAFLADFSDQADISPSAWGTVFALDDYGNGTYMWMNAIHLTVKPAVGEVNGSLLPNQLVEVIRQRGLSVERYTTMSASDGYVYADFFDNFLPGDQIWLQGAGGAVGYQVVDFSVTAEALTDAITGSTAAGADLRVVSENHAADGWGGWSLVTACGAQYACASLSSSISGDFSLVNAFDLQRGDVVALQVFDSAGNAQSHSYNLPLLAADPQSDWLRGYWEAQQADLTVEVRGSTGELKTTLQVVSGYDHTFEAGFGIDLLAGDQVTVTGSTDVQAMTVLPVSAHLNSTAENINGNAAAGWRLLDVRDANPADGSLLRVCSVSATFPGGNYAINLTASGVEAGDEAYVSIRGADGHYSQAYSHALLMDVRLDSGAVRGFAPLPGAWVTATLLTSGGSVLESQSVFAGAGGAYELAFDAGALAAGQKVRVASSGESNEFALPLLTINLDPVSNTVYGLSVPGRSGTASLLQAIGCDGACMRGIAQGYTADAAGNYAVSFQGWRWPDCSMAEVEGVCSFAGIAYTRDDEHRLRLYSPAPTHVPADIYEEDNTFVDAVGYSGASDHSFHVEADVDWISFTVEAGDVGQVYFLNTFRLGLMEDTTMFLYDRNGTTVLAFNDDGPNGLASQIIFQPENRGTYYVKIVPYDSVENTGNCGSTYAFIITRWRTLLPLIKR